MTPISDQTKALEDMAEAERSVQHILAATAPGQAMSSLLTLYRSTSESKREALIAVLATRVALTNRMRVPASA